MKKNVSGQVIGAQMVSASDGSAFTGSVTAYVTGDGGTQAAGSVGSGACTHEGNGFHTYAPAQAETNYDHVAFTFTGTGAVPSTVQVFTTFPQTGDNYARLGAPAGASVSADIAAVKTQTAAIEVDTQDIQTSVADLPTNSELATALGNLNDISPAEVNAEVDTALADVGLTTTVTGRIDAAISTRLADASYTAPDNASITGIKAKTDNLTFTVAGQVDANTESMNGAEILGDGSSGNLWRGV